MATSNTILRRLRYTPIRDIVRLRLTGRMDLRALLDKSGLPAPAAECVGRVVKRTRLWKLEKTDVAQELIAHFHDGLASGQAAESLLAGFGNEKQTAKLIRRAKIRNRPLAWHALRWMRRGVATLIVFYIGLVIYFYAGKPTIRTDYLARFNAAAAVPKDQAAWPLYRQALIQLKLSSPEMERIWEKVFTRDGATHWEPLETFVEQHQDAINLIRQGSGRAGMGVLAGAPLSIADQLALTGNSGGKGKIVGASGDELIWNFTLPHLGQLRPMVRLLIADARMAIKTDDGARFMSDFNAIFGIARQAIGQPLIINYLVAVSIRAMGIELLGDALVKRPELFSNAQLRDLAHQLAPLASDAVHLSGERMMFYDFIQRTYTDDGHGDGRFTFAGRLMNRDLAGHHAPDKIIAMGMGYSVLPAESFVMGSRKEVLARYDQIMDKLEAAARRPFREVATNDLGPDTHELSLLEKIRYGMVVARSPAKAMRGILASQEIERGMIDGATIGIALEFYRRDHGHWPDTLDALAPAYMPKLPVDRITGGPLHYRIIDGQPLVYSVGVDRKDDGGRSSVDEHGKPDSHMAATWYEPSPMSSGDWVLWPVPED